MPFRQIARLAPATAAGNGFTVMVTVAMADSQETWWRVETAILAYFVVWVKAPGVYPLPVAADITVQSAPLFTDYFQI